MPRIIVDILDGGKKTQIEVEGVVGPQCSKMTEALEAALGTVKTKVMKKEHVQNQARLEH